MQDDDRLRTLAQIPPLSAAAHYHAAATMWEARAKGLQALVDAQDAEISRLREQLARYEPPDQTAGEPDALAE